MVEEYESRAGLHIAVISESRTTGITSFAMNQISKDVASISNEIRGGGGQNAMVKDNPATFIQ